MNTLAQNKIDPALFAPGDSDRFERMRLGEFRPVLLSKSGIVFELPGQLNDLPVSIAEAVHQNESVSLLRRLETRTTHEAADYLDISKQFLIPLLDNPEIPHHCVRTHR